MIAEAILRGADAVDALKKFDPEVRRQYLNASEAMTCARKQWYAKNDAEKDGPENWGYARRGHAVEHYAVAMLRAANVPMIATGDDQLSIQDDELRISCTPDGLVQFDDEWYAAEFKSIDPRTNVANLPKDEHVRQVQIAAAMIEKHHPDLVPHIKGCRLIYINCSDFNTIHEFTVPLKPMILDQLKGRANRILDARDATRLPREGMQTPGKAECKQRCPFNKVCGFDGAGSSTNQGSAANADASTQVGIVLAAQATMSEAKARQDQAKERLKAILKNNSVAQMSIDGHSVSLTQRAGSVSYAKVVKDHLPGVDLEPYRGAPVETLTVK